MISLSKSGLVIDDEPLPLIDGMTALYGSPYGSESPSLYNLLKCLVSFLEMIACSYLLAFLFQLCNSSDSAGSCYVVRIFWL